MTIYLNYNHLMRKIMVLCLMLMTACSSNGSNPASIPKTLKSYWTTTPSATASQPSGLVVTITTPIPTPTPFSYSVKSGDTMGQIAQTFNVSLSALMAANPGVDPNSISIGQALKIPSQQNASGASTPTPVSFPVRQIACYPASDRGMWCFVLAANNSSNPIEDVTAQITLLDTGGKTIASQTATLLLDVLAPNSSMPLIAYFEPDVPVNARPQVQVLTAIQIQANDPRYLPAVLQNTSVKVDATGLTAQVGGQINLPTSAKPAKLIWVVATAYDGSGRVLGARRWESTTGLSAGGSLPFSFTVSSIAGTIAHVEFAVEARP